MKLVVVVVYVIYSKLSLRLTMLNPLSPKSDQHEISPHNINALENIVVVRIEYMIREDESI